jgi:hypothetical protein
VLITQHRTALQDDQHAQGVEVPREHTWEVGVLQGETHHKLARETREHVWCGHVLHNATVFDLSMSDGLCNAE